MTLQQRTRFPDHPVQLNIRLLRHERAIIALKAAESKMTVVEYCRLKLGLPSAIEKVEEDES